MPFPGKIPLAGEMGLSLQTKDIIPSAAFCAIVWADERLRHISRLGWSLLRKFFNRIGTSSLAGALRTTTEPARKPP